MATAKRGSQHPARRGAKTQTPLGFAGAHRPRPSPPPTPLTPLQRNPRNVSINQSTRPRTFQTVNYTLYTVNSARPNSPGSPPPALPPTWLRMAHLKLSPPLLCTPPPIPTSTPCRAWQPLKGNLVNSQRAEPDLICAQVPRGAGGHETLVRVLRNRKTQNHLFPDSSNPVAFPLVSILVGQFCLK